MTHVERLDANGPYSKNRNMASTAPKYLSVWNMEAYYGESYIIQGVSFDI
ncbi:MAG: branched-chain amino acid transport system ATP-binding protein, partial [Octadecabacter sp.]